METLHAGFLKNCFIILISFILGIGQVAGQAVNKIQKIKVLSTQFGVLYYEDSKKQDGFSVKPVTTIPNDANYYGWIVRVQCPAKMESVDWTEVTYMPGPNLSAKPGVFEDDHSITVAQDLKSFTTRRGSLCKNGTARIDDIYGRENSEPLGGWRIEVWHEKERLVEFRYTIAEHFKK